VKTLSEVGEAACAWVEASAHGHGESDTYLRLCLAVEGHMPSDVRLSGIDEVGRLAVAWFAMADRAAPFARDTAEEAAYDAMATAVRWVNRARRTT
jgi:hypothetical protein